MTTIRSTRLSGEPAPMIVDIDDKPIKTKRAPKTSTTT